MRCDPGRLRTLSAQCWVAAQVELQGHYTVTRVQEFAHYHAHTSWMRALVVCLLTPLPCIICVVLINLIPLEPTTVGAMYSPHLWTRTFLSTVAMTLATLESFRQHVNGMELTRLTMVVLTLVISVITIFLTILMAIGIGYPTPFGLILGTFPWFTTFIFALACAKRTALRTNDHQLVWDTLRYLVVCCCQIAITLIYPLYNYVFVRLSSSSQTAFVLILPILKILAKNWIARALPESDAGKPEAVVFNIEIFHSLYVAFCMQGATSTRTVFALIGVDFVQAWLSFHDVQTLVRELAPVANKLDQARQRTNSMGSKSRKALDHFLELAACIVAVEPHLALQKQQQRRQRTAPSSRLPPRGRLATLRQSVEGLVGAAISHIISPAAVQPVERQVSIVDGGGSEQPRQAAVSPRQANAATATVTPLSPPPPATSSASSASFLLRVDSVLPAPPRLPSDLATLNVIERRLLVHGIQRLLYVTEFIVLVEYVEVIMPVVYNILMVALYQHPNRQYYPFLKNLTMAAFWPTLSNVLLYASLEFVSLVLLTMVVAWKLRVSLLHQLAFVLENRQASVQSKLVIWVIYVMQCSIDHFGADYSFRFAWLRESTPT